VIDNHDLVGAYATDALDDEERSAVEAHLRGCAACRDELAAYREVLGSLPTRAVAPPPELEDRVVLAATGSTTVADAAADRPERPSAGRSRRRRAPMLLAAAAAATMVFALGGVAGRLSAPVAPVDGSGRAAVDAVLAVATAADATFVPADVMGTDARVVISEEMGKVAFVATDLPTPAKGECYQVWRVAPDGTKSSAGVFTPGADGVVAVVLDAGADTASFVITTEPPGGSKEPTGAMVGQVTA
jgi:anti-sigma factor RsiW